EDRLRGVGDRQRVRERRGIRERDRPAKVYVVAAADGHGAVIEGHGVRERGRGDGLQGAVDQGNGAATEHSAAAEAQNAAAEHRAAAIAAGVWQYQASGAGTDTRAIGAAD